MADVTFPGSYLTESLKLGDARTARAFKTKFGLDELDAKDVGLPLSFSEDRALTTVQSLFAFGGLKPLGNGPPLPTGRGAVGMSRASNHGDRARTLAQHFEIAKQLSLLETFGVPSTVRDKWLIDLRM